jgi:hypothetical protein
MAVIEASTLLPSMTALSSVMVKGQGGRTLAPSTLAAAASHTLHTTSGRRPQAAWSGTPPSA